MSAATAPTKDNESRPETKEVKGQQTEDNSNPGKRRQSKPRPKKSHSSTSVRETANPKAQVIQVISPPQPRPGKPRNNYFYNKARKERHDLECLKVKVEIAHTLLQVKDFRVILLSVFSI